MIFAFPAWALTDRRACKPRLKRPAPSGVAISHARSGVRRRWRPRRHGRTCCRSSALVVPHLGPRRRCWRRDFRMLRAIAPPQKFLVRKPSICTATRRARRRRSARRRARCFSPYMRTLCGRLCPTVAPRLIHGTAHAQHERLFRRHTQDGSLARMRATAQLELARTLQRGGKREQPQGGHAQRGGDHEARDA